MTTDLFGQSMDEVPAYAPTRRVSKSGKVRYVTQPGGYAAQPGTGPLGEKCLTCYHYCRVQSGNRVFPKCGLMRDRWTGGPGSDIRAGSPACCKWRNGV